MIEKLNAPQPMWDEDYVMKVARKLNEVIEAVEELDEVLSALVRHLDFKMTPVDDTAKSPGFRPLHIEDGQVQESAAYGYGQNLDEAKAYTAALLRPFSVLEVEPQEQETIAGPFSPLEEALDDFERLAQNEEACMCQRRGWDKPAFLVRARKAVIAAAHREYALSVHPPDFLARPQQGMAAHRYVRERWTQVGGVWHRITEGSADQQAWTIVLDEVKPLGPSAAQPGKGV